MLRRAINVQRQVEQERRWRRCPGSLLLGVNGSIKLLLSMWFYLPLLRLLPESIPCKHVLWVPTMECANNKATAATHFGFHLHSGLLVGCQQKSSVLSILSSCCVFWVATGETVEIWNFCYLRGPFPSEKEIISSLVVAANLKKPGNFFSFIVWWIAHVTQLWPTHLRKYCSLPLLTPNTLDSDKTSCEHLEIKLNSMKLLELTEKISQ